MVRKTPAQYGLTAAIRRALPRDGEQITYHPRPSGEREGTHAQHGEGEGVAPPNRCWPERLKAVEAPPCVFALWQVCGGAAPGHDPARRCDHEPVTPLVRSPRVSLVPWPHLPSP